MAEAADEYPAKAECGFCFSTGEALVDPKTLPCSHVHCLQCLHMSQEHCGLVQCPLPLCREVFDIPINKLPAYTAGGNNSLCDICTKKGQGNKTAVMYCTSCTNKYCTKHQQSHDDVFGEHLKISIAEYLAQVNKLQVVGCDEHSGLPYVMGCSCCLAVFCVHCIADKSSCADGGVHELVTLAQLVEQLAKETSGLKAKMVDKEEKLSTLFKITSKVVMDFEHQTDEMVDALRKARNEQMEAIDIKYAQLEEELLERRHNSRTQMIEFLEEGVGMKLSDLSKHRINIEARFKHSNQVEIISKYRETRDLIKCLIEETLPSLEVQYLATLHNTGTNRDIELEIVCEEDGSIEYEKGLTVCRPIPKAAVLLKDLAMPSACRSLCHYKGNTYVGLDDYSIARVDANYQITISVIRFVSYVESIIVYNDRIYTLMYGNPYVVYVHDLAGNLVQQWNHTDNTTGGVGSKLAIIADQLVVPDRLNKRITIYSLNGEVIKEVACPQLSGGIVAICAAGKDSVVVSDSNNRNIFRFSLSTGQVTWTTAAVTYPQGLALYRKNFVCVYSSNTRQIHTLNMKTGEVLTNFAENSINGNIYDMQVDGKTLISAKSGTTSLVFSTMSM